MGIVFGALVSIFSDARPSFLQRTIVFSFKGVWLCRFGELCLIGDCLMLIRVAASLGGRG